MERKRYGVFGSAFDPITIGHLVTMEMVRDRRGLDGIILIPSSDIRADKVQDLSPNEDRLSMIQLAIEDNPHFHVNDIELRAHAWETYTYNTMEKLKKEYPNDELFFVMGADNLANITTWHKGQELIENNKFIVMGREGYDMPEMIARNSFLTKHEHRFDCLSKGVNVETSSTLIRSRIENGMSVKYLVPELALQYALEKELYK
ncbi:nicotinate (nicotinamide) nucleotide adenylyltransferase [Pontibacillus sp. ALD_SL1]|uniref:nicotinate-nucleotide adenylyltransferase n=1 Tax=Pontibacillus sp. ALD_SL1 TaxID=2777185 RepID=UPI001A978AB1|nr:nicotinate-nucleotide adenylyltransferase [Pontibacillus sp. ALD_SL1]QST00972.1 nicotinate (nicotinamide) nucleotide adenylyltransferase [Pontibacillus sp. ALD_SL1]